MITNDKACSFTGTNVVILSLDIPTYIENTKILEQKMRRKLYFLKQKYLKIEKQPILYQDGQISCVRCVHGFDNVRNCLLSVDHLMSPRLREGSWKICKCHVFALGTC